MQLFSYSHGSLLVLTIVSSFVKPYIIIIIIITIAVVFSSKFQVVVKVSFFVGSPVGEHLLLMISVMIFNESIV